MRPAFVSKNPAKAKHYLIVGAGPVGTLFALEVCFDIKSVHIAPRNYSIKTL